MDTLYRDMTNCMFLTGWDCLLRGNRFYSLWLLSTLMQKCASISANGDMTSLLLLSPPANLLNFLSITPPPPLPALREELSNLALSPVCVSLGSARCITPSHIPPPLPWYLSVNIWNSWYCRLSAGCGRSRFVPSGLPHAAVFNSDPDLWVKAADWSFFFLFYKTVLICFITCTEQ